MGISLFVCSFMHLRSQAVVRIKVNIKTALSYWRAIPNFAVSQPDDNWTRCIACNVSINGDRVAVEINLHVATVSLCRSRLLRLTYEQSPGG